MKFWDYTTDEKQVLEIHLEENVTQDFGLTQDFISSQTLLCVHMCKKGARE